MGFTVQMCPGCIERYHVHTCGRVRERRIPKKSECKKESASTDPNIETVAVSSRIVKQETDRPPLAPAIKHVENTSLIEGRSATTQQETSQPASSSSIPSAEEPNTQAETNQTEEIDAPTPIPLPPTSSSSSISSVAADVPPSPVAQLETVLSGEKFCILRLPENAYLYSLIEKLGRLLAKFTIDNFDILTSSDRKRKILTSVSYKSELSPENLVLKKKIEALKVDILDLTLTSLTDIPLFQHITEMVGSVLGSGEGALPQPVHVDYDGDNLLGVGAKRWPWSMLLPINEHCLFGARLEDGEQWLKVRHGQLLIFRGDLYHCGGPNPIRGPQFRIHAYGVTADIRPPTNAIIIHPTEPHIKVPPPTVEKEEQLGRGCKRHS